MKGAKIVNAILVNSKEVEYYTFLSPIFKAINNKQREYNWLITEPELNWIPDHFLDYVDQYSSGDRGDRYCLSGNQLTQLVTDHDIQFIWGVLSGFPKDEQIDIHDLSVVPCIEGNSRFWEPGNSVQHPKAEIEIVCWDSTLTLLISKDQTVIKDFMNFFKDAKDLDQHNLKN